MDESNATASLPNLAGGISQWVEDFLLPVFAEGSGLGQLLAVLDSLVGGLIDLLLLPHPFIIIGIVAAIVFATSRRIVTTCLAIISLVAIAITGLWQPAMTTLILAVIASFVALLLGYLAVGLQRILKSFGRAFTISMSLISLIVAPILLVVSGLATTPGYFVMILIAALLLLPFTFAGIRQAFASIPKARVDALLAIGANDKQIFTLVEKPFLIPRLGNVFARTLPVSLLIMMAGALLGIEGLGAELARAIQTQQVLTGTQAMIAIGALAILLHDLQRSLIPDMRPAS